MEKIVSQARHRLPQEGETRKKAETEITYLEKNRERMRYGDFRRQGLSVRPGMVEAASKILGPSLARD